MLSWFGMANPILLRHYYVGVQRGFQRRRSQTGDDATTPRSSHLMNSHPRTLEDSFMILRLAIFLGLAATAVAKPNIVFMFADDLGWNDVSYHGSEIRTPHIDALVSKGLELDRYYAFPVCSPTRAAFLTGRSPIRLGIHAPIGIRGGLPLDEHLLPQTLQTAGYQTVLVGKWHLGLERVSSHPYRRGFDHTYGHLGPSVDYFTHIWGGGLDWYRNGKVLREDGYSTDLITAEAVSRIENRDRSRPLFLYVAFNAPHTPLQAPPDSMEPYAGIDSRGRRVYAAMVSTMDAGVGRILQVLDDERMTGNTIVVWASDNGGGRNVGASNLPLRGFKGSAYEGGIRVPATMRWPGVLGEGEKFDQMVTAQDWFPTLVSAVGLEAGNSKPFDGVDMWPALGEGTQVSRPETIIGVGGNNAIFREGWKLVTFRPRGSDQTATQLFRITDDPREERDMAEAMPDMVRELTGVLREMPRAPSVGADVPPRRARRGAAQKGKRRKGARGRVRADAAAFEGAPSETREPWLEAAIKD